MVVGYESDGVSVAGIGALFTLIVTVPLGLVLVIKKFLAPAVATSRCPISEPAWLETRSAWFRHKKPRESTGFPGFSLCARRGT